MFDPNNYTKAEFDQQVASIRDELPSCWWALYKGCMEKGFSEIQALELLKTWISRS
jgi:hypothetical protein